MSFVPTPASLSLRGAHLINAVITLGYVLPLYFTKYTRLSFRKTPGPRSKDVSERWRDDPAVIKARLLSVFVSTTASLYLIHYIITTCQEKSPVCNGPPPGFSFRKCDLPAYLVTPTLFLGPLYGRYLGHGSFMLRWTFDERKKDTFNWVSVRNYVVGPISEELVWRSCLICVYRLAGASNVFTIFFTPVSFGSAHLHHVWETYNVHGRTTQALRHAILLTLFQFAYTTLFGFHSAFLFLRTSSLLPSVSAHIFCNIMGFPQLQAELRWYPYHRKRRLSLRWVITLLYAYGMKAWTLRQDSAFWVLPVI
ncbi:hypothetical protein B0F90DRAFT_1807853 [Multifurca ochricompacta]|uniref:intramembrane prenyl-peptidase Rce1 n=1 Tax=Multifurca ochricompacta TaxID=376703 RepID=A0AAD4MDS9_9AGAM|nr:hypothetical protein B0F90DRAFT_1807853 [Multifurca ochricompacta]